MPLPATTAQARAPAATGVPGLDDVLHGGLTPGCTYLVEGAPGTGKTTLALQFLLEGVRRGESGLYLALSESEPELCAIAESHGWSLEGIEVRELLPRLDPEQQYTVFHASDVELVETATAMMKHIGDLRPTRVVIDSLSELRHLAGTSLRYRRQIMALKQLAAGGPGSTIVLVDDHVPGQDDHGRTIANGVVVLEQSQPDYGSERRRLKVVKYRGHTYRGGYHDFVIRRGGLHVYPRITTAPTRQVSSHEVLRSGIPQLDSLLGGGLERGTSTLIRGPAGTGKSSLAARFVLSAAEKGQRGSYFMFDESLGTFQTRTRGLGMDLEPHIEAGRVHLQQIDPAELTPGEFAAVVQRATERERTSVVVIDSLKGYLQAMREERSLAIQLHELLKYLSQREIATIVIGVHSELIESPMVSLADTSHVADSIILLRYFESAGNVRQAISVVKKRSGAHDRTIREFSLVDGGIRVGEPLREFRGLFFTPSGDPARILGTKRRKRIDS